MPRRRTLPTKFSPRMKGHIMSKISLRRVAGAFLAGFVFSAAGTAFAADVKPEAVVVAAQRPHSFADSALVTGQQDRDSVLLSNVNAGN